MTYNIRLALFTIITINCLAQPSFEIQPLVQLPGVNTNFQISNPVFDIESVFYICWVNRVDSSSSSIYRMSISPSVGAPELIVSSTNQISNPDINFEGDVIWQEMVNEYWVLKYFSSYDQTISTITDSTSNSYQPRVSGEILVFVQEDSLKYYHLFYQSSGIIDTGNIANPDIAPDADYGFWTTTYEKHVDDSSAIWQGVKWRDSYDIDLYELTNAGLNINPRYGVWGGLVYQILVNELWAIGFGADMEPLVLPYNAINPFIFSPPIVTQREVISGLVFFEGDSLTDDLEIYASTFFSNEIINISNMEGNDYNPQVTYLPPNSIAVLWEHEVENGRELWWAKDTLRLSTSIEQESPSLPNTSVVVHVYPNPFNPSTTIEYELPEQAKVSLAIYDVTGREVQTLVTKSQVAGSYQATWDGTDQSCNQVAAGMYFARLQAGEYSSVVKMVYLR
ncbi:MAG: T9SS type A sorting domain-containing protein [Candidatus Marinimicrobia bacterium]|nr:T9SS type A sorting domain-containing protein [Candidatus Neomarinimicrobiota bacterium]